MSAVVAPMIVCECKFNHIYVCCLAQLVRYIVLICTVLSVWWSILCVCMYVSCISWCVCVCVYVCVCLCECMHACMCVCECMHACMRVYVFVMYACNMYTAACTVFESVLVFTAVPV